MTMRRLGWIDPRPDEPTLKEAMSNYTPGALGFTPEEQERHLAAQREEANRQLTPARASALPTESAERKAVPLVTGLLDYFPAALAEVARVSRAGNDKHNPGQPLHHSRGKSTDHADSLLRHLADRGYIDPDTGMRHSAEVAWRALALLQEELEDAGAPLARAAWHDPVPDYDQPLPRRGGSGKA